MGGRWTRIVCFLAAVLALAGCDRREPSIARIEAKNYGAFYYWRSSVSRQFTPEHWKAFNDAVQELRYEAMAQGVTGSDAINEVMCRQIDGRSVDEVLRAADNTRLQRLRAERDKLKAMVDANALLAARPGDEDLAAALEQRRSDQLDRLRHVMMEITAARQQFAADGGTLTTEDPGDATAAVLSRDEAWSELMTLIGRRREIAAERYGDWPARIDREGRDLGGPEREKFDEANAVSAYSGHEVIPVYVRARWRIFDAVVNYPRFGDAVMHNLTAEDRRLLDEAWADSEAEIWARREASRQPADAEAADIKAQIEAVMRH